MRNPLLAPPAPQPLTCFYRSGEILRSRSVGGLVLAGHVDVPAPPARLLADWQRETCERLGLEPGDVEALSLPRARRQWPDYSRCMQAVSEWMHSLGLPGLPGASDVALMACRGADYHHDAAQYGEMVFCNLFLSEDRGQDVVFPATGQRIPLERGTVLLFDTAQPHAVIARQHSGFAAADFPADQDGNQVFLTWELPVEQADVARVLGVAFDTDPASALRLDTEQVWLNGAPALVCPQSGLWRVAG
jgi:hypothetical protein